MLFKYGEEQAARKIAREICSRREERPIDTTGQLAELIASVVRRKPGGKHPATKTFQAIRIFINREMEAIERGLEQAVDALRPGGRLAVISFHSLEDRIVKNAFRELAVGNGNCGSLEVLTRKVVRPSVEEVESNPRSRSAKLRVGEKLEDTLK